MTEFFGELRTVLERGDDLPTLSAVVLELHRVLDDDMATNDDIALVIERDPALATRLLRLSNSAAFNRGQPVASVRHALSILGLQQVRWLSVAMSVVGTFGSKGGGLGHRTFWGHSAGVALIASRLAQCLNFRHIPPEQLYVGGLLHDVGLLVLDQYFPEAMQRCLAASQTEHRPLAAVEMSRFGMNHGEVGGLLLGRWGLPASLVAMVSGHHEPHRGAAEHRDACWLIYAAELVSHGQGAPLTLEGLSEDQSTVILDAIREAGYEVDELFADVPARAAELAAAFT